MAMNRREKLLAGGVGGLVLLFVGQSVYFSILTGFDKKQQELAALETKQKDQHLEQTAGLIASQKLNKIVTRSLPRSEEKARADYQQWLITLADEANLGDPAPRFLSENRDKDTFQLFKFQLAGTGTLETATQLLYGFYAKDYLHRITHFDVRPIANAKTPDQLSISLECEVLALGLAKDDQAPPKSKSIRLAKSMDDYKKTILNRNMFSPTNQPPALSPSRTVEAKTGSRLEHMVDAKDPDALHVVRYELVGEAPEGLSLDKETGRLTFTSAKTGEFSVVVKATDNGLPSKSTTQKLTIKVSDPPPIKVEKKFDIASQAMVTALISGRNGREAWVLSKTDSKTIQLRQGDELKLGDVQGKVTDIGQSYVEFETEGRKWLVGLDESLADAYMRSQTD